MCTSIVLGTARLARAVAVWGDDAHSAGAGVSHQDGAVAEAGDALNGCGEQRLISVPVHISGVCALARQGVNLTCHHNMPNLSGICLGAHWSADLS